MPASVSATPWLALVAAGCQIAFKRADLRRLAPMRHVKLIGGAAEMRRVGDGDGSSATAQVQIHGPPVRRCLPGYRTSAKRSLGHRSGQ